MILNINKPVGITSYDVVRELKKKYPGQKIGHAGTLDPLAGGVLICLVGTDSTKKQSEFMECPKEYEFEVLFGFKTDTYDILGLADDFSAYSPEVVLDQTKKSLKVYVGKIKQKVPPFSAVKVNGKQLYRWYLDGQIDQVEIPVKDIEIEKIEILESHILTRDEMKKRILELVNTVKKGFRQDKVKDKWEDVLSKTQQENFLLVKIRATVSKGTYVRAIANDLGEKLGTGACTMSITRTRVGKYDIKYAV